MFHLLASIMLVSMAGIIKDVAMGAHIQQRETGCTLAGVVYPAGHTMCLPSATNMTPMPPSAEDQQAIIDKHNEYRSGVDPVPCDMMKMYWDANIAMVAQAWVETCPGASIEVAHDKDRSVPAYGIYIGQNGAFGTASFTSAVNMWYNEVSDFTYGADNEFMKVGHFTQVVSGKAIAIGCGKANCPDHSYKNIIFCNYAFGQSGVSTPYQVDGTAGCTNTCGSHCVDNLCDCGDMLCKNGGTLDKATCTCTCPEIYEGDTCEIVKCPNAAGTSVVCENGGTLNTETCACSCLSLFSGDTCQTLTCPQMETDCSKWGSTPSCSWNPTRNDCPMTCGLCEPPCDGMKCENGGTLDPNACTCSCTALYSGDTCQTLNCPQAETDCSKWGSTPSCSWTPTLNDCPMTCGLCEPACDGKNCENGGTLDFDSCTCSCPSLYQGDTCQTINCPATAETWCKWGDNQCWYQPATLDCPYTCGLC